MRRSMTTVLQQVAKKNPFLMRVTVFAALMTVRAAACSFTILCLALSTIASEVARGGELTHYTCGWVGNSFGGGYTKDYWVQLAIEDIAVAPDGRVFTASMWDEGKKTYGIYKDGRIWDNGNRAWNGTGVGAFGGSGVDPKGVTVAILPRRELMYASTRGNSNVVGCWKFDGKATAFTAKTDFLPLGLAVNDHFLAACGDNLVKLFDTVSGTFIRQWSAPDAGKAEFEADGDLWVIAGASVREYSTAGELKRTIPGPENWKPVDICFDPLGRLLVADNGPSHQVRFFDVSAAPREVDTLGITGGIKAGVPGEVAPLKFWGLTGCGTDNQGNVYVATSENGVVLRSFSPAKKLRWKLWGLHFIDVVAADPREDGLHLYGVQEHYVMDYARPPGQQWTLKDYTLDLDSFPEDPRRLKSHEHGTPWVAYIDGRKFLFLTGMTGGTISIFKFQGAVAVPAAMFAIPGKVASATPHAPPGQSFLWQDANGNGRFDREEFSEAELFGWCWWVSGDGSVWTSKKNRIIRYSPRGLDVHGNPRYGSDSKQIIQAPENPKWSDVQRTIYDAATDTMYLSGYTPEHPAKEGKFGMNRSMGPVLARYRGWSTNQLTPDWTVVLKHVYNNDSTVAGVVAFETQLQPRSFDVAGDYIFVVYESFGPAGTSVVESRGEVDVYRVSDGAAVGHFLPTASIGGPPPTPNRNRPTIVGAVDVVQGLRAFKRNNGEYLVFVEDDKWAKVFFYHWKPVAIP